MPRVGNKRSDRRWEAPDGTIWASKFEFQVFTKLTALGVVGRKCEQGGSDTFAYTTPIGTGRCAQCGSGQVVQERTYTPDVHISADSPVTCFEGDGYVEAKGFFPADKRGLLRHFRKTGPSINLCVIANADHWVTKGRSRLSDYFKRYFKDVEFMIWRGSNPDRWELPPHWYE